MVDSGNSVMSSIAARDQDLAGTVMQANTFFGNLDQIFGDLTPYDRKSLEESPAKGDAAVLASHGGPGTDVPGPLHLGDTGSGAHQPSGSGGGRGG